MHDIPVQFSIVLKNQRDAELNFAQEIEKLPVTNFSTLKLYFAPGWHVYGALASQLLRMRRIRAATKKLMVVQPSWPEVIACHAYGSYSLHCILFVMILVQIQTSNHDKNYGVEEVHSTDQ
jgi:hypothetical protein